LPRKSERNPNVATSERLGTNRAAKKGDQAKILKSGKKEYRRGEFSTWAGSEIGRAKGREGKRGPGNPMTGKKGKEEACYPRRGDREGKRKGQLYS